MVVTNNTTKTNDLAKETEQISLTNPNGIMEFATNLKKMILQNDLYTDIRGKNYVNVEGWQIAGAFTGIFPVVETVENLSTGDEYKYRAEVSLRDGNDNKVGYGVAICTNKEPGKTRFDEFAVASMAQTRAVGKAFRMKIGWLLKIAGYETTPAEEMSSVQEADVVQEKKRKTREISYAIDRLERAKTMQELRRVFVDIGDIRYEEEVAKKKDEMKIKLADTEVKDDEDE